jgi:two-component system KDP operon response regulator KdpE
VSESGPRVLIVDDEYAIRRFLRASLTAHKHTVFEAVSGQAALVAVAMHRPDVVILDLGLPDMDGVEVTRQLRSGARSRLSSFLCASKRRTRSPRWMPGRMTT